MTLSDLMQKMAGHPDQPKFFIACEDCPREGRKTNRPIPAIGFIRNAFDRDCNEIQGHRLQPVCTECRGDCEKTFVSLNEGWREYEVQRILED